MRNKCTLRLLRHGVEVGLHPTGGLGCVSPQEFKYSQRKEKSDSRRTITRGTRSPYYSVLGGFYPWI